MVFRRMLDDPEWRQLSSSAKVVWLYLRAKFNYQNLGEVSLTYSEMEGLMSSKTFARSKEELEAKGWRSRAASTAESAPTPSRVLTDSSS